VLGAERGSDRQVGGGHAGSQTRGTLICCSTMVMSLIRVRRLAALPPARSGTLRGVRSTNTPPLAASYRSGVDVRPACRLPASSVFPAWHVCAKPQTQPDRAASPGPECWVPAPDRTALSGEPRQQGRAARDVPAAKRTTTKAMAQLLAEDAASPGRPGPSRARPAGPSGRTVPDPVAYETPTTPVGHSPRPAATGDVPPAYDPGCRATSGCSRQ
jgi:hypothetical protein